MKTFISLSLITALIFILTSFSGVVFAGKLKCWYETVMIDGKQEKVRSCGQSVPPEFSQQGHQELSSQGMVIGEQERAKTKEEIDEEARLADIEEEKERQREKQALKDKILLGTFTSVEDLITLRDSKISVIESRISLTKKRNEKIQQDLDKRIKAAATEQRSGKKPNKALLKDIESLRRQIKNNEAFIEDRRKEQDNVKEASNADVERFKGLKGL